METPENKVSVRLSLKNLGYCSSGFQVEKVVQEAVIFLQEIAEVRLWYCTAQRFNPLWSRGPVSPELLMYVSRSGTAEV